jgi:hypothetical protein
VPVNLCLRNEDDCGENASCVDLAEGGYECRCFYGFAGDGVTCAPDAAEQAALAAVYWGAEVGVSCKAGLEVAWPGELGVAQRAALAPLCAPGCSHSMRSIRMHFNESHANLCSTHSQPTLN